MSSETNIWSGFSIDGLYNTIDSNNGTEKQSVLYANGRMQTRVYLRFTLDSTVESDLTSVKEHIAANTTFYSKLSGKKITDMGWTVSNTKNEFETNIDYIETFSSAANTSTAARTVLFFLSAPLEANGVKLELTATIAPPENSGVDSTDLTTESSTDPLVIYCKQLVLRPSNIKMTEKVQSPDRLRVLQYSQSDPTAVPATHKILRWHDFGSAAVIGDSSGLYLTMVHGLQTNQYKLGFLIDWSAPMKYPTYFQNFSAKSFWPDQIINFRETMANYPRFTRDQADEGAAMLRVDRILCQHMTGGIDRYNFDRGISGARIIDNYGNVFRVDINWNVDGTWGDWSVKELILEA